MMKKIVASFVLLCALLFVPISVNADQMKHYVSQDDSGLFSDMTIDDNRFVAKTSIQNIYDNFAEFVALIDIEEKAALKNANTDKEVKPTIDLAEAINNIASEEMSEKEIVTMLQFEIPGVHVLFERPNTFYIVINGVEWTQTDGNLNGRFAGEKFISFEEEGDSLRLNDQLFELETE